MNRRYYFVFSTLFCTLLIATFYYSLHTVTQSSASTESIIDHLFSQKHAFATAICDPLMVEAALVSIYSLNSAFHKKPSSKQDIIVLLPQAFHNNTKTIQSFEMLDTKVVLTDECNLAHLWALLDYQKIVYFSPNVVFEDNTNTLFSLPTHAALNSDDTPLFVLEPNSVTFESLLHKKAQTNYFSIDPSLYKKEISSLALKDVVHIYDGPMKPWNFHAYSDVDWKKYYDPIGFYKWRRINNELRRVIDPYSEWKNQKRQRQICDKYIQSSKPVFSITNKFSVLISTYNPDRIEHLSLIIRHLLKSKKVHTVFVTWHNPELDVPENLIKDRRVKVLRQSFDSLNNRFNPVKDLATDAVYIMDDDIYIDLTDLEFTFDVWRSRKDSVVGHFPRLHKYDPETLEADYNLIGKAPYSIILTKSMFIRSDYLFAYTCLLEPKLHEAVDERLNCEDLGFSMMASGLSGVGSSFVRPSKALEDFGLAKGISINNSHMPTRSVCISDFITNYWNKNDPLISSYDTVVAFQKPQIKTGDWNRVEKLIG